MGLLSAVRRMIYEEQTKYKAGISESVAQYIGSSINFINLYQHSEKQFFLNGPYGSVGAQTFVDGLVIFNFNAEIFNVYMFNAVAGTSGTTELDLKIATTPGGSFTSIFTTTPKITSTAVAGAYIGVGNTVSGCTAPVLAASAATITAGTALRCDKIQSMLNAENTGLVVHYRPR